MRQASCKVLILYLNPSSKNESWDTSLKLDLVNMGVATEQVENVINVVESFTAKVPDHVQAQGPHAEDLWRFRAVI